jgi:hypothetical protein
MTGFNLYSQGTSAFNFSLSNNKKYIVSAWVKESHETPQKKYDNGKLRVVFYSNESGQLVPQTNDYVFETSGKIIEGWQRIVGVFLVPEDVVHLRVQLKNESANVDCYFDDIRIFPFNGSMKSFVYDKDTQRLMAELDENNYATYYEYDQEGGLVRVKKETEKGVYTIQETRSKSKKQQ